MRNTESVRNLLEWLMDHNKEDVRVTIGCRTCKETNNLLAATALTAWLNPFHAEHDVWIRNPFFYQKNAVPKERV
jgi:hypothetical protein